MKTAADINKDLTIFTRRITGANTRHEAIIISLKLLIHLNREISASLLKDYKSKQF